MMILKDWEDLPEQLRTDAVRPYYDAIRSRVVGLAAKRLFDIVVSLILLTILLPVFAVLAVAIKLVSSGPVFSDKSALRSMEKLFASTNSVLWSKTQTSWAHR